MELEEGEEEDEGNKKSSIKWEQDNISNFFSVQEIKFKEILEANSNLLGNKQNKDTSKNEANNNNETNDGNQKNEIENTNKENNTTEVKDDTGGQKNKNVDKKEKNNGKEEARDAVLD